jgi:tRNA(Ile)-lysidine synthase
VTSPKNKALAELLGRLPSAPAYWVAYSGGVDSHVLLHLLWQQRAGLPGPLGAVHVNHQLQGQSGDWEIHCRAVCEELGVAFHILKVDAHPRPGESPEAAARTARYRGLADWLGEDQVLVTGQHLDDQAETLLLQLFRGAGPRGLAAMPERASFGRGRLVRPLLSVRRNQILAYAHQERLRWVEDPSNTDLRYHRNLLRQRLMPELQQHWPGIASVLARAAWHQADQLELADTVARQDFDVCALSSGRCLSRSALAELSPARARNLLRYWTAVNALPLPPQATVERMRREILDSREDACPRVHWPGAEVRRHRDRLYLMSPLPQMQRDQCHPWDPRAALVLQDARGELSARPVLGRGLRMPQGSRVEVRFRCGGEALQPAGRGHRHALKKLFQEWAVPEWERGRVPLLYVDDRLAAVAGLCVAEGFQAGPGEWGVELRWSRILNWQ